MNKIFVGFMENFSIASSQPTSVSPSSFIASDHKILGITALLLAMFTYTTANAFFKAGDNVYPALQVVFCRNFFALIPYYLILKSQKLSVKTTQFPTHLWRGIIGATGMAGLFGAITLMPFSDANVFLSTSPFFVCILSWPLLREHITLKAWLWIILGFAGVILTAGPSGLVTWEGVAMALGFTATEGLLMVHSRLFSKAEHPARMTFYFGLIASAFTALIIIACEVSGLATGFVIPTPRDLFMLMMLGIGGGIGQFLVTLAYSKAPAQTLAPLVFTALLWGVFYGMFFFGETLTWPLILGSILIIMSGIRIVRI